MRCGARTGPPCRAARRIAPRQRRAWRGGGIKDLQRPGRGDGEGDGDAGLNVAVSVSAGAAAVTAASSAPAVPPRPEAARRQEARLAAQQSKSSRPAAATREAPALPQLCPSQRRPGGTQACLRSAADRHRGRRPVSALWGSLHAVHLAHVPCASKTLLSQGRVRA